MKSIIFTLVCLMGLVLGMASQSVYAQENLAGHWYATLQAPAGEMPFELTFEKEGQSYQGKLADGHHQVVLQNFKTIGEQLTFGIDDARVRFEVARQGDKLVGNWIRGGKVVAKLPFTATTIQPHPAFDKAKAQAFVGEWRCFAEEDGKKTPISLIVKIDGSTITGTGIDPTGDFGAMIGQLVGNKLVLSRFDGQSLSLVVAERTETGLRAAVSTSPRSQFAIVGAREGESLPDPSTVAKVDKGLKFSFTNLQGQKVDFPNAQFQGKAVIINIMGTWCHNCHDETPFLIELYEKYHSQGLEVISLCFEAQATEAEDLKAIANYQHSRKIPYTMLYAGKLDDGSPAKAINGLTEFGGYPTNIFIARDGQISTTHTGFWGPATGEKYQVVRKEFEETIKKLLVN